MELKDTKRKKRTQRDYTLPFKLAVVASVEKGEMTYKQAQDLYGIQGRSTVLVWLRKHGTLDWSVSMKNLKKCPKAKETPAQQIKRLEKELEDAKLKIRIYQKAIEISDNQYGTDLGKKLYTGQLESFSKKK